MANLINKVVYAGNTLIDLTADTITAADVINKKTFHAKDGSKQTGTCTFDADTSSATATAAEILTGSTAFVNAVKVTGSMPNNGGFNRSISTKDQKVTIPAGYHDGSGKIGIADVEKTKLVDSNIRIGVELFGITGTYTGSELIKATTGSATPSNAQQVILPSEDGDFDYFTQFTVAPIPYTETQNSAGGYTATIG